ncbi:MAG: flagellar export chaperone FliS [Acidothermus sp.]|nr:flagellar export chaperone FliS [Acidothermus sp.]
MNAQARYLADAVTTASPARLVVMLYDRLVLDIVQGRDALAEGRAEAADRHLRHAQDIVFELRKSLRLDVWDGARQLASIYAWLIKELVAANVSRDAAKADDCRRLVEPLRDAWRAAAERLAAEVPDGARLDVCVAKVS